MSDSKSANKTPMARRFRGFLPVIIDVETGGFNAQTDALLQIGATTLRMDNEGYLYKDSTYFYQVEPFKNANLEKAALDFTGIDPFHPLRGARPEDEVLKEFYQHIRKAVKDNGCTRAVLVGHNAHFDHNFMMAAAERCDIKRNPFHPFSCFDTATLAGFVLGQTVLAKACILAGIPFDNAAAHAADYDAERTAELFCLMVNRFKNIGGWDLAVRATKLQEND
ncbi:Ribonuclease T [Sinobacterium norvegicum]|uniref:Ribonuclease T n=2 Tax=Sinobacterium norvegicum TaxID=1641715 RepID=A0ABN8EHC3_9GAMM|nr:Ribonuclease T [Sinobacterium norvegicum]